MASLSKTNKCSLVYGYVRFLIKDQKLFECDDLGVLHKKMKGKGKGKGKGKCVLYMILTYHRA